MPPTPRPQAWWCGWPADPAASNGPRRWDCPNAAPRDPLTPEHTFRIASNTKTYVAAAILRLAESGRLSLDDPLGDHLDPDFHQASAG